MFSRSLNYWTDNIKLGKKIGSGAQAEIFEATCGPEVVVVKRFLDTTHKSTKQEVGIIKRLTHKHIVLFYYVHHDMIVMEYVEGGNLAEAIVGRRLKSWEVKTHIAKDISLGLAYLLSQGIIHCDIKSSNILLSEYNEAKICDIGLATRLGEDGGGGGTLRWMTPELLQPPPRYTSKSDVYALGMVMWEMASESTQPYRGHTTDGVMCCILCWIIEKFPDDTPKDYATCIQMCWKQSPDERPTAMNVIPDIVQSPHQQVDREQQQQRNAMKTDEKEHYRKALKQYFTDSASAGLVDILKSSDMLRDNGKAMDWFDSTADGYGSAKAMFKIGSMYNFGQGVEQDYGKALEWYLAASDVGVTVAMLKIGQMYQYGRGMEQDDSIADMWYRRAEGTVNEQSKPNNRIIHHSSGVSEHHRKTLIWFNTNEGAGSVAATFTR